MMEAQRTIGRCVDCKNTYSNGCIACTVCGADPYVVCTHCPPESILAGD